MNLNLLIQQGYNFLHNLSLNLMKHFSWLIPLIIIVFARDNPSYAQRYRTKQLQILPTNEENYDFKQVLDHYDYLSTTYWNQRYWVYQTYFNPKIGPVFLFICGQSTCNGVPKSRQWIITLAQRLQGLVLVLEHRFYGKSLPFGKDSLSLQNMRLLNAQQALRDLAYFQQQITKDKLYSVNNNPWITVGGSYPGALSAWYRYKYPHLAIGAIASSAVILVKEEIKQFDEQVYLSSQQSGEFCSSALNSSNYKVQQILDASEGSASSFKSQFPGALKLTNNEFLFFWADSIALTIQYGGRTYICDKLKGLTKENQFTVIVQNAKTFPVYEYGSYYLKNETLAYETQSAARQWYYQQCTQYGDFQTYSLQHPMRSKRLNLEFFKQFCSDSFGVSPQVERKNTEYGGLNLKATNIFFSNGIQDPWRWASLQSTNKSNLITRAADCPNCAHCVDLNTPSRDDSDSLRKLRDEQFLTISEWIQSYWQKGDEMLGNKMVVEDK